MLPGTPRPELVRAPEQLPPAPRPLARGTSRTARIDPGRFEVVRRLGVGGMGVVYEAMDHERGHAVALKTLRQLTGPALLRFKNEFRALSGIHHRHLIRLYELACVDGEWLFTMELIRGGHLLDHLRPEDLVVGEASTGGKTATVSRSATPAGDGAGYPTSTVTVTVDGRDEVGASALPDSPLVTQTHTLPGRACQNIDLLRDCMRQLAEGVSFLHSRGRLHRDIKPSNVLVTDDGRVVLCDFGLVTEMGRRPSAITGTDRIVGTVSYMSPEQAVGIPLDEASDWYSVGVVLYRALTGRVPFGNSPRVLQLKQSAEPLSPSVVAPGVPADLAALCVDLLRRDPARRPTGDQVLECLGASPRVAVPARLDTARELVGRDDELEALRGAYRQVKSGLGTVAFVHAPSGMGKTSLVRAFLEEVEAEPDALVLTGRCYQQESLPYKAFDALVDGLSEHLASLPLHEVDALVPTDAQALSVLFPVLGRLDAVVAPALRSFRLRDPTEVRRRAFRAVRELLGNLARTRRVVLFIDDLQWGDLDSGALLTSLMNADDAPPILVVATYRSDEAETSPVLESLVGPRADHEMNALGVALAPLDEAAGTALAGALVADATHPVDTAAIARESAGNPMLLRELVWYSSGPHVAPVRASIDGMLRSRVAALPRPTREVLAVVCVAGRPTSIAVVRRAADADGDFADHLVVLREQRLIRIQKTASGEMVAPYHDRVRESVLALLSKARAADCHGRIARAMQSVGRVDSEELVDHWLAAGEETQAATAAVAAAEQADRALAFDRAVRLYSLALELPGAENDASSGLERRLGEALLNAGRGPEAADAFLVAATGATAAEGLELKRRAALEYLCSGFVDEGMSILQEVMRSVGFRFAATPRRALWSLALRRTVAALRGVRFRRRDPSQVSAEVLARVDVCWTAAVGLGFVNTIRGAELQTKHLGLALRAGEPERVVRALTAESCFHAVRGGRGWERARVLIDIARPLAEEIDLDRPRAVLRGAEAFCAYHAGRLADARDFAEDARRMSRGTRGMPWERVQASLFRIWACYYLGDVDTMRTEMRATREAAREHGDLYGTTALDTGVPALMHLLDDAPDVLAERTREAVRTWSSTGYHVTHVWGTIAMASRDLSIGRAQRALERVVAAWPEARRSQLLRVRVLHDELCDLRARAAIGVAAAASPGVDVSGSLSSARRDARRLLRSGGWFDGVGHARLAGIERDPARAARSFRRAAEVLDEREMRLLATAARARASQLEGDGEAVCDAMDDLRRDGVKNPSALVACLMPIVARTE